MANEEYIYQRGETVPIHADVQDWDDAYVDPTSIVIDVWDVSGTKKVTAQAMSKLETGKYVYYYTSLAADEEGWWRSMATITDGSGAGAKVTMRPGSFKLQ